MHKFHACISPTNAVLFSVLFKLRRDDILGGKKRRISLSSLSSSLGFVSFFLNDSKLLLHRNVVIFHRLPRFVRDIFTEAFRIHEMGYGGV